MDNLTSSGFNAKILGKKYNIKFQIRNFIALKKRFNVETHELIEKVLNGDEEAIIRIIWCGTLIFDDFDAEDPTKIKEEIDIKRLYCMEASDLREISLEITKGLLDSMPKATAKKKKIPAGMVESLKKIKALLRIK